MAGRNVQSHACPEGLLQVAISMRIAPGYRNPFADLIKPYMCKPFYGLPEMKKGNRR